MSSIGIVFGGSGFIGTHLLHHLSKTGRHMKLFSLDIQEPPVQLPGVIYHKLDLTKPIPTELGQTGATLYNLVAVRDFPGHEEHVYYDVNVVSSERIIDFAEKTGAKEIVFTSTMSIYGTDEDPKTEDSILAPVNPYGNSKRIGEILHEAWHERDRNRKLVVCRPAVIFGHRDRGNYTRLSQALKRGFFIYVGRNDTVKSAGYVGDLVRSFTFCLDREEPSILYNFAYPHPYTIKEIVETMCRVGSYRVPKTTLPVPLLMLIAIPFEFLNAIGVTNPIHRDRLAKLYQSTHIVPKWLTEHGFVFETDLESALTKWKEQSPEGEFV